MSRARRWIHTGVLAACVGSTQASAQAEQAPAPPVAPEPQAAPPTAPEPQAAPASSAAPTSIPPSLEVWGALGPSVLFGEPANPEYAGSFTRVGALGEIGVAYRSSYFIDPHISVGYATLATGVAHLPAGPWGPAGDVDQHLGAWLISPGITADIWRFRLRLGIGLAVVMQSFDFQGNHSSSTQLPILQQLGVGFNAFDSGRFRLDAEARVVAARGADISFVTLNVVARGDLIRFGGSSTQVGAR